MKKATKPGNEEVQRISWGYIVVHDDDRTACKHGVGNCDACGTSDLRDTKHTTRGGKGLVAQLRDRKK